MTKAISNFDFDLRYEPDTGQMYAILPPETYAKVMFISERPRWETAVNRGWFGIYPPRTEWWVKTAQWFIRRGQQIVSHYRYWRYVRRL